ncbi:hypothetical protein ColTof3_13076 [Colletotrichum tofieldiae]|nr:hypothetical protein ColTof3_13076 [Colletotrichum tofieldiae]
MEGCLQDRWFGCQFNHSHSLYELFCKSIRHLIPAGDIHGRLFIAMVGIGVASLTMSTGSEGITGRSLFHPFAGWIHPGVMWRAIHV